ncbi:hypothetical protein QR685DRAFT_575437 [Neurospora intermedia]|uniref:Uncharacterized protein n=1 Tax=Neurospora intermedia TaxID=5142 RepID=A0ABR3D0R4_NEUIN
MFCSSIHVRDNFSSSSKHSPTTGELWREYISVQVSGMESERFRQYRSTRSKEESTSSTGKETNEKTNCTRLWQVEADRGRRVRMSTINSDSLSLVVNAFVIRADASPFVSFLVAVCGTPASLVSFQFSTVSYCTTISLSRPLWLGANQGVDD